MKPLRPAIPFLLSVSLSIGVLSPDGRSQQPSPKTGDRGGAQSPNNEQTPKVPAASSEKKAPKERTQLADEDGAKAADATLKRENKSNLTELQQRGLDLAQQVGEEAYDLDDRRNSAIVQAAAADVIWPYRKEPARERFRKAFETAVAYYQETQDDNRRQLSKNSWTSRQDVRVEVLKLINKRDPEMGREYNEKFIEAKKREGEEKAARGAASAQRQPGMTGFFGGNVAATDGLIDAANTLLSEDARMAADIARRAVALGVSMEIARFLPTLARRDRAAADALYLYALEVLKSNPAPLPGQVLALGAYPFGEGEVRISDGSNNSSWGFGKPENFTIDTQLVQKFLMVSLGVLLRLADPAITQMPNGTSHLSTALYAAKVLEPKVTAFYPALQDQWQAVTSRLAALNADGSGPRIIQQAEQRASRLRDERSQQGGPRQPTSVETLLDRAQTTKDFAQRDDLYKQAAFSAASAGDLSRALEIVGRISDLTFRGKVNSWINFDAAQKAAGERRYEEARKYALEVEETDHRAYLFFEIAEKALGDKDRARAIELLEEAAKRAGEADDTQEKVKALCGITNLYLKIDQARSFSLAEAAVRAANEVPSDKLNPGEEDSQLVRTLSHAGSTTTNTSGVEGFDLRKVFRRLASHDFDRTLALAQPIENKSLRYRAMIAVAESVFVTR